MTRVYGSCTIEPEGMDLDDETRVVICPCCGGPAVSRHLEVYEGGSIGVYDFVRCGGCHHHEGDYPPDPYADQWPIAEWCDPWADDGDDTWAEDRQEQVACPRCGTPAVLHHLEVRGGEVEMHEGRGFTSCHFVRCDACGLNADDFPPNPFKPAVSPTSRSAGKVGRDPRRDEEGTPMTRVYGGCIEPGGMELEDEREQVPCPRCGKPAVHRHVELCEDGSINCYDFTRCCACGYLKGDVPDQWAEHWSNNDGWFDPEDPYFAVPPNDEVGLDDPEAEPDHPEPDPPPTGRRRPAHWLIPRHRGGGMGLAAYSSGLLLLGTVLGLLARRVIPRR